jgi:hypothetical protein
MSQSQQRLAQISSQLSPAASAKAKVLQKNPDDIVSDVVASLPPKLTIAGYHFSYSLCTHPLQKRCFQRHFLGASFDLNTRGMQLFELVSIHPPNN